MADLARGKDSLMKRLLSSGPNMTSMSSSYSSSIGDYPSSIPSPSSDSSEDASTNLSNFLRQLASQSGCELNVVAVDHAYAKPSNWRSENTCAQPTKTLFVLHMPSPHRTVTKAESALDVESIAETPQAPYDVAAVNISMSECENYIDSVKPAEKGDDWEEHVNRAGWTNLQQRVFSKMVRMLHADRLARLACAGTWNEPVQRRTIVDRTARRARQLLSCYNWETKITQWLHVTLLENLSSTYLAIYLDVLQTMRAKVPVLVDRMISTSSAVSRPGLSGLESLNVILKQPWDPVVSSLNELKPRKLPGNPVLLMVPAAPVCSSVLTQRQKQWESYFSALGMVSTVMVKSDSETSKMSLSNCLDQIMCATRVKVAHLRAEYPGRHIILVGCNAGASAACHIALVEPVSAVVCLGFAVNTVEGKRGEPNDTLLDVPSPVFFVIGENAATSQQEDLEDIRERMRVETGLVVVGAADDLLRVSSMKKLAEGVTQSMVDRCILDEVGDFLGGILMHPRPITLRSNASMTDLPSNGIVKIEKRKISSSEPSSPAAKRSRPGTPLHGATPVVTSSAPSTPPTSKSTLTTLPTLLSVSGTKGPRQKPRMTAAQKLQSNPGSPEVKWAGQQQVGNNPDQASQGITVNIGSLGSLTPIGPIRLSQTSTGSLTANTPPMSDATSLTIQGNLISSNTMEKPPVRAVNKPADSGTLTSLSTLLQGNPAARIMVSSASSLLTTNQQLKGEDSLQEMSSNAGTRMRTTSGRMLDLSKLTVLAPTSGATGKNLLNTNSGNVVMLADSSRTNRPTAGGGPLLVPVSSPFTLVPLSNKGGRTSTERTSNQRSYTVIPKITVPSLKLNQQSSKLPYSVNPTEMDSKDDDVLSAAKILELPIIFAKDGEDPIFSEDKLGPEPPTVVPISACGSGESSSTVTLGDTISFPLDPDLDGEKTKTVPNVFIIRSKNAREKAQPSTKRTQRIIRTVDRSQSNVKASSGIKYTKIILTNRNASSKVDPGELSGISLKHGHLQSIEPGDGTDDPHTL